MMSKKISFILFAVSIVYIFIFAIQESAIKKELAKQAEEQIKIYSAQIKHAEQVTRSLTAQINQLESASKERETELQNALKDNKCSNERVPASVTDRLRKRADSLR